MLLYFLVALWAGTWPIGRIEHEDLLYEVSCYRRETLGDRVLELCDLLEGLVLVGPFERWAACQQLVDDAAPRPDVGPGLRISS